MLKKLKQKKQLLLALFIGILSINLLGFLPFFATAQAQTPRGTQDCTLSPTDIASSIIKVTKYKVNADETFDIYTEIRLTSAAQQKCASAQDTQAFSYYLYTSTSLGCNNLSYNYRVSSFASPFSENGAFVGFREKVTGATLNKFFAGSNNQPGSSLCLYTYYHPRTTSPSSSTPYITYLGGPNDTAGYIIKEDGNHQITDASIPTGVETTAWENLLVNNNQEAAKADQIAIDIKPAPDGSGLRSKYRVSLEDITNIQFGVTKGLDAIFADWGANSPKLGYNQYIGIPKDSKGILEYDFSPQFKYVKLYFADGSKTWDPATQCNKNVQSGVDEKCDAIVHVDDNFASGSTDTFSTHGIPPGGFNPTIKPQTWIAPFTGKTATSGQALGTVQLYVIPILWGNSGGRLVSYVIGKGTLSKVALEVFSKDADIIAACKADSTVSDKTKCDDLNFAKFGFASTVTQSSSSAENAANDPKTLFGFILEVIVYIVVAITSVIYWIFSYVLVPVLNALIRIHPFRDSFVNVVYPGWLIMRNLANIAFIIALLVMGLRVLFQFDDAGKTRGFIIRLILMALLVNFSLVIAQGVVAIADTVQSQFLPGNTKVIEALGKALMADPAITFQTKLNTNGALDSAATANLFTPIMLLITSVAGFFAFLALAAFIAIRTVALWVFYLTSPFAYFGRVLEQTKGMADRWWKEFLKYVFMVPILTFFLNIAALMAGTLARQNSINPQATSGLFADQAIAGIEGVTLTIISQAVVLLFLFAGMKVATSSGTIGSKAVVDYAQRGFKNALTKWPGTVKDFAADRLATGLERAGAPGLAKALTAGAKPLAFGKAIKKANWDEPGERRIKRQAERLGDTFLTRSGGEDTSKLGSSLKGARAKMKDFESDDENYLRQRMTSAAKKNDRDTLTASMLKLGQEGKFKQMLEEAKNVTGKEYTKDASGLNAMTEDMVKSGKISDANRRDLLNEFDQASKKKKGNTHYGGNMSYDGKKFNVRKRNADGSFVNNTLENKDSWTRAQIKARTGDDPKGSLKTDLTQAHESAAVGTDGRLTDAQVGVFAEQTVNNLNKPRIWDSAEEANPNKFRKMREALDTEDKRNEVRGRMIRYYNAVADGGADPLAEDKATRRMEALQRQIFRNNVIPEGEANQGGGNNPGVNAQGQNIPNPPAQDDDDDDGDDEIPQATTRGTNVISINPISTSQAVPTMGGTAPRTSNQSPAASPIGDQPVFTQQETNLTRGSASISNVSPSEGEANPPIKTSNKAGFNAGKMKAAEPKDYGESKQRLFGGAEKSKEEKPAKPASAPASPPQPAAPETPAPAIAEIPDEDN